MYTKLKRGNWVVLYYSEYCGYCTTFLPIWELFLKQNHKNLNKLKINVNKFDASKINPSIDGVPTIHFYKNGKIAKNGIFNESRTLEKLNLFCLQNLKSKKTRDKKSKKTRDKKSKKNKKKLSK